MMVSPSKRSANYHQKYHQIAGMEWSLADPAEMIIPQKPKKTAAYGTFWHALGRHFGDPYGYGSEIPVTLMASQPIDLETDS
jgi:hypothetical protein